MILRQHHQFSRKKLLFTLAAAILFFYACKTLQKQSAPEEKVVATPSVTVVPSGRVLVFIKTKGYYHESIPTGAGAIIQLGKQNGFAADSTSDASVFTEERLRQYNVIVFLSTTMNVLNADQQVAFERFIQAGGGFVGIHAATDTEYDWPWYNKLVGAYFLSHPRQQKATIRVTDKNHPATSFLPDTWERFDEWYNFKNVQPDITVLAWLDETTYQGGSMGDNHPFAWYHDFDGGHAFYTEGGHTKESYSDSLFLRHLLGGIRYAMGSLSDDNSSALVHPISLDYTKSYSVKAPEENRFTKTVLSNDLNEPMELAVAPDGRVFFTERSGMFYVYEPVTKKTRLLREFPAKAVDKYLNGLIGITLDPDFGTNSFIYFFYSSNSGNNYHQNISRFKILPNGNLDTTSEKIIIKVPIDLEVSAHTGGSLAWDKNKNLFISTGDNTVPFESEGYAPLDERPGRLVYDAQRSAGNPNDLRGKILRIHPESDGTYTIPAGNLFPPGTPGTKPEIFVMGCRNPYRISVDYETSYVYWGEVGPDAGRDSRHAPRGYDEFNQARKPGNFGWPYFVGDSKAYNDSDFAAKTIGQLFDINGPVNNS
ncbi:MAG TPA: ThuA domain-containing protein, partial [Flavitalea sp.]|nr:ThuA domain-containing protein [Flavitalea sp.]